MAESPLSEILCTSCNFEVVVACFPLGFEILSFMDASISIFPKTLDLPFLSLHPVPFPHVAHLPVDIQAARPEV